MAFLFGEDARGGRGRYTSGESLNSISAPIEQPLKEVEMPEAPGSISAAPGIPLLAATAEFHRAFVKFRSFARVERSAVSAAVAKYGAARVMVLQVVSPFKVKVDSTASPSSALCASRLRSPRSAASARTGSAQIPRPMPSASLPT